ncbi:MAG TPA: NUDIX domain-containing protein [Chloroflexota bacterium]
MVCSEPGSAERQRRLLDILNGYAAASADEARDVARLRQLVRDRDPWTRASALHVTGSAVVVHVPSRRVLLRWHERMQAWLQVGGHADPHETDPYRIAHREAGEETGLGDLMPWPDAERPRVVQITIVPVPPGNGEPAHEHGDIRYALATSQPEAIVAENSRAQLAWLTIDQALARVGEDNLRVCLERVGALLEANAPA